MAVRNGKKMKKRKNEKKSGDFCDRIAHLTGIMETAVEDLFSAANELLDFAQEIDSREDGEESNREKIREVRSILESLE